MMGIQERIFKVHNLIFIVTLAYLTSADLANPPNKALNDVIDKNIENTFDDFFSIVEDDDNEENHDTSQTAQDRVEPPLEDSDFDANSRRVPVDTVKNCGVGQMCVVIDPKLLEEKNEPPISRTDKKIGRCEAQGNDSESDECECYSEEEDVNATTTQCLEEDGKLCEVVKPRNCSQQPGETTTEYIPEEIKKAYDPTELYHDYGDYQPLRILRKIFRSIFRANLTEMLSQGGLKKRFVITENVRNDSSEESNSDEYSEEINEEDDTEKKLRKFSTDYVDVDDLYARAGSEKPTTSKPKEKEEARVSKPKVKGEARVSKPKDKGEARVSKPKDKGEARVSKPVSLDYIDPDGHLLHKLIPAEIYKRLRRKPPSSPATMEFRKTVVKKWMPVFEEERVSIDEKGRKQNNKRKTPERHTKSHLRKPSRERKEEIKRDRLRQQKEILAKTLIDSLKKTKMGRVTSKPHVQKLWHNWADEPADSSDEEEITSDSDEGPTTRKPYKPELKRFQVVKMNKGKSVTTDSDESDKLVSEEAETDAAVETDAAAEEEAEASAEVDAEEPLELKEWKTSESIASLSVETTTRRLTKKRPRIIGKPEIYMQGTRLITEGRDFRRRLPYFMPKRYHWNPEDFSELGYFWFNGPQGRDPPGSWKIAY